jgi:hypothetical protein
MTVTLIADVTLNGTTADATVYEGTRERTTNVNSISLDTSVPEITVDALVEGNATVTITVYEDTDQDGTAETTEQITVSNGTNTYSLSSISGGSGNDYWVEIDIDAKVNYIEEETVSLQDGKNEYTLSTLPGLGRNDNWVEITMAQDYESTAVVNSLEVSAEFIVNAQAATVSISGQNPAVSPGTASISAGECVITSLGENAALAAGAVSISANPGVITLDDQDAAISAGKTQIQADEASVQITAQNAARVFDSTTLSGTVTLSGSAVEAATIYCIDDTNQNIAEVTTTDANGDYMVRVDTGDLYHMVVQYEDDQGNQYNDESKPFIAT